MTGYCSLVQSSHIIVNMCGKRFQFMLVVTSALLSVVQSLFPTQDEQVNLLTNIQELFEQIKQTAKSDLIAMDNALKADIEATMEQSRFLISTMEELTILRLTSSNNLVCLFDAKEKIIDAAEWSRQRLEFCSHKGFQVLDSNSFNLTETIDSSIKSGEELLAKLNACSEKRSFQMIDCYKKIIQDDVLPVKTILSEAIDDYRDGHLRAFKMNTELHECVKEITTSLKIELDQQLESGLNCT